MPSINHSNPFSPRKGMIAIGGMSGAGKSTLAEALAKAYPDLVVLDSDVLHKQMHGVDPKTPLPVEAYALQNRERLIAYLHAQAAKRGVTLEVVAPARLPAIRANPDQVQQVLVNLVLNALDACDRKERVELSAARRGESIVMEVRDDGHGIPRAAQAQVFDPFFTTKKRGQGTGLGLWVVAQIMRAHAGEIELESAPDAGTRVRVAWPVTP